MLVLPRSGGTASPVRARNLMVGSLKTVSGTEVERVKPDAATSTRNRRGATMPPVTLRCETGAELMEPDRLVCCRPRLVSECFAMTKRDDR
ncbi:hypothetical protein [Rhodomicrobium lacus]|uniref:hypothetical protein n=1 Tax=Rhodomicrobium lacus TaxID=2498452 RepID=UPI0026E249E6|nr:hypothetical protein [Rhodomicrobium lacus]WKW50483.1 hypothetical protein QMO75_14555 [Rhodomicrobium lacus]